MRTLTGKNRKPHVVLLVDFKGWAFDHSARELQKQLSDEFDITIHYIEETKTVKGVKCDLLYVFFWGEFRHTELKLPAARVIKQVSSHRWVDDPRFGPCTPPEMAARYLMDADTVICTSARLTATFKPLRQRVFHTPNGIDVNRFKRTVAREGPMVIGWAGNANDKVKGLRDLLEPACDGEFTLRIAPGNLSHLQMAEFYNGIDVLAIASVHEGEPLTLPEAMACGCFPVAPDIGIVPELVRHGENGWMVSSRTVDEYKVAFRWCRDNLQAVRAAGVRNAEEIAVSRDWARCAETFRDVFRNTLDYASGNKGSGRN